jgi:hypothetical protein
MLFNTNIKAQYNRQQFRQVDVEGLGLEPHIEETLCSITSMVSIITNKIVKIKLHCVTNNVRNYLTQDNVVDSYNLG